IKPGDADCLQLYSFVSNLPYSATSTDLQTLFSDIAPVALAFVVTEQGTGVSKGVGYVSFTLKEDAQAAFDTISNDGLNIASRALRVQWAESKPRERKDQIKSDAKPRPKAPNPKAQVPRDPLAIRTVIVSGLPTGVDSKILWKKFRKSSGAESIEWPVKSEEGKEDSGSATILFSSPADALNAVAKLHAHVFKGNLLSAALKKRMDSLSKAPAVPGKTSATKAQPSHASRLIVRNIPFNATEQDLRAVFLPYGPVYSIHIPTEESKGKGPDTDPPARPRTKGYAFVWMLSKKDAEKAMDKCNGMTIRAGLAEGLVSDKQKKKKVRRIESKMMNAGKAEGPENDNEEEEDHKLAMERVIAVDWVLSKDKWKEAKAQLEAEAEDVEMEDLSSDGSSEDDSEDDSDSEDSHVGVHAGDSDDGDSDDSIDDEDEDGENKPVKPQLPPPEEGTTLFVRNVPFSATDDELRILFRTYGPLRYARITVDPETGRSRGTGFACFWNKADADKVVEQSDMLRAETTGSSTLAKKNPFSMPSILTADPSSSLAQSLVLQGRTLDVVRAVTRDVAGKLKEDGERQRQKADKRNMYLLREGVILPNTPAEETLSAADLERRTTSYNTRRALLKSNPALFISKTRLSIRQIPIFVTERVLKRLAIHATRAFQDDVKSGSRQALTTDELAEDDTEAENMPKAGKLSKKAQLSMRTGVRQAKIVRQTDRVDPVTGKGRSRGYGFVEMNKHTDALRVLRWANNNPAAGPLFETWWAEELQDLIKTEKAKEASERDSGRLKRLEDDLAKGSGKKAKGTLIVEFSIENVTTIHRRNTIQKDRASKPAQKPAPEEPPAKKQRVAAKPQTENPPKLGSSMGALIGRKRKERKSGKK
ncbi:unnamed protein product, partial [Mycena citricolor]